MARRIEIPFAEDGDFEEVPMDAQPDDTVSYAEGYTFDYQRPAGSSPLAKEIGRQGFNGILNDLSGVAKQFQDDGSPEWYAGVEYSRGARVKHADEYWACAIETGTTTEEPGTGEDWAQITIPARAIKNNLTATTAPTVDDDETLGYEPLSTWINTSTTEAYTCISAAEGAAHWELGTLTADQLGSMALQNSDTVSVTGGSIDGTTIGATTPSSASVTSLSSSGDITLTGNGRKIKAEMSSATASNNLTLQSSTTNNFSVLNVIPNGTGNFASVSICNASDPNNASYIGLQATASAMRITSNSAGSGSNLPLNLLTAGTTAISIDTSQNSTMSGNIIFSGNGRKITGEMSSGTLTNNVAFQSSTTNGITSMTAIPNGTATTAAFNLHNSSDVNNSAVFQISSRNPGVRLSSFRNGSATLEPILFLMNVVEQGCLSTNGNWGFGVASGSVDTSAKIQSSNGIKLGNSANANANVLDWYEEGNFTLTVRAGGVAVGGSVTTNTGRYTRIGNRVFIRIELIWNSLTGSGAIDLAGLPFTTNANNRTVWNVRAIQFVAPGDAGGPDAWQNPTQMFGETLGSSTTISLGAYNPVTGNTASFDLADNVNINKLILNGFIEV